MKIRRPILWRPSTVLCRGLALHRQHPLGGRSRGVRRRAIPPFCSTSSTSPPASRFCTSELTGSGDYTAVMANLLAKGKVID